VKQVAQRTTPFLVVHVERHLDRARNR